MHRRAEFTGACGHAASRRKYIAGYRVFGGTIFGSVYCGTCSKFVPAVALKTGLRVRPASDSTFGVNVFGEPSITVRDLEEQWSSISQLQEEFGR